MCEAQHPGSALPLRQEIFVCFWLHQLFSTCRLQLLWMFVLFVYAFLLCPSFSQPARPMGTRDVDSS